MYYVCSPELGGNKEYIYVIWSTVLLAYAARAVVRFDEHARNSVHVKWNIRLIFCHP